MNGFVLGVALVGCAGAFVARSAGTLAGIVSEWRTDRLAR